MAPGLAMPFEARGDVDAVAHQVAVALLDDVADMNADAEFDAPVLRHAGVALDQAVLHFDRAADRVDDAAELDDAAVAGALDSTAVMSGDSRVDEIAPQTAKARERSVLVGAGKPAVADDVGHQDRGEFAGLAHRAPLGVATLAEIPAPSLPVLGAKDRSYAHSFRTWRQAGRASATGRTCVFARFEEPLVAERRVTVSIGRKARLLVGKDRSPPLKLPSVASEIGLAAQAGHLSELPADRREGRLAAARRCCRIVCKREVLWWSSNREIDERLFAAVH